MTRPFALVDLVSSAPSVDERPMAVCGWEQGTQELVDALIEGGALRTVAVGDPRAAALVRARRAIPGPCFQHVLEMVRTADYDVLLIVSDAHASDASVIAARRGATLLVDAARLSAASLDAVARSAERYGVPFASLRPGLPLAPLELIGEALSVTNTVPDSVAMEVEAERSAIESLRDAIGALLALVTDAPLRVVAASAGSAEERETIHVQVRFREGAVASVVARRSPEPRFRLSLGAGSARIEADIRSAAGSVTFRQTGQTRTSFLTASDGPAIEASRAARASEVSAEDLRAARRESPTLAAIELALDHGGVEDVPQPAPTPLRVLPGGGARTRASASPRLRLLRG